MIAAPSPGRPQQQQQPEPEPWTEDTTLDAHTPQAARRYDALRGGKDNFRADRAAADQIEAAFPHARTAAEENRRFVLRMAHHLATEYGIKQFLDIGCGLPTDVNVHDVVQKVHRDARVVYVDNDPLVATHSRALLTGAREGRCEFVPGDVRHPRMLLAHPTLRTTLNLTQPVAVLMMAVLHFIPDADEPHQRVRTLLDGLPAGSYLAISHGCGGLLPAEIQDSLVAVAKDPAQGPLVSRTREQIAAFADGMRLIEPGVVPIVTWLPDIDPRPHPASTAAQVPVYGLLAAPAAGS